MNALSFITQSAEETQRAGAAVAAACAEGDLLALEGELGAGKTQFVRGLAGGLGLDGRQVSSPTFVTVQEYWPEVETAPDGSRNLVLVHIDAWRMEGRPGELEGIGWGRHGESLRQGAVLAVEWPGKMGRAIGPDFLEIRLFHGENGTRKIFMAGFGAAVARMQPVMEALRKAGFDPQVHGSDSIRIA